MARIARRSRHRRRATAAAGAGCEGQVVTQYMGGRRRGRDYSCSTPKAYRGRVNQPYSCPHDEHRPQREKLFRNRSWKYRRCSRWGLGAL